MDIENRIDYEDPKQIEQTLINNSLDRNKHLSNIMRIFNSINSSFTLSIDGNWGSGKTIFAKQLEYLAHQKNLNSETQPRIKINWDQVTTFQKQFDVYYFNSWEYDIFENPLEIFLFDLINQRQKTMIGQDRRIKKFNETIEKRAIPIMKALGTAAIGVDFEVALNGLTKEEALLSSTTPIKDLKDKITELIDALTAENKIIIIIDELDRCKPTFAVELLEMLKHYFSNEKLSFLVCSNKSELSHTVKQYYGQNFNAFGYLDRFIDLEYNLPSPDTTTYLNKTFATVNGGLPYQHIIEMNCTYFDFSLREINKYVLLSKMVIDSFTLQQHSRSANSLMHLLFPLYALGLKLKNTTDFQKFISNQGDLELLQYVGKNENTFREMFPQGFSNSPSFEDLDELKKYVKDQYSKLFGDKDPIRGNFAKNSFFEILAFIN